MARRSHRWALLPMFFLLLSQLAIGQQSNASQQAPTARNLLSLEESAPGTADSATDASIPAPQNDVVLRGGTILTVTHGKIENGSIYIHNGKIAAIGKTVHAPAVARGTHAARTGALPSL